jgi:capsular exopolysaccharide synthesis family protein
MSDNDDVADAYAALLGAVRLCPSLSAGSSILVTSTEPGEGKTTVASCLALTASLAGQEVLLIDGDLRRSSLASAIGVTDCVGLTEILSGQTTANEAVQGLAFRQSRNTGSISVMAGGLKPSLFLPAIDWSKARTVLKLIARDFGIVLLDSPPILAVNDALLLASVVDAVLLVVAAGSANLDEVRAAKEQLDAVGTPVIGAVLNKFEPNIHGRSNQPYRGYNGRAHR